MSYAEELAKELYPTLETDKIGNNPYISYNVEQLAKREGYVKGYMQANKKMIENFLKFMIYISYPSEQFLFEEVLEKFKEKKEK